MILGNLIVFLGDERKTLNEVLLNLLISLEQSATVILGVERGLGGSGIRHAGILSTLGLATVRHAEDFGQDEVVIGTNHEGLTLDSVHVCTLGGGDFLTLNHTGPFKLVDALQNSIGNCDSAIAGVPDAGGGVTAANVEVDIFPCKHLFVGL